MQTGENREKEEKEPRGRSEEGKPMKRGHVGLRVALGAVLVAGMAGAVQSATDCQKYHGTTKDALGVHYDVTNPEIKAEMERRGYTNVRDIVKEEPRIGCNDARVQVQNRAGERSGRCEGCWEYQGGSDWSVGANCHIYRFTFDEFTGPRDTHKASCRSGSE